MGKENGTKIKKCRKCGKELTEEDKSISVFDMMFKGFYPATWSHNIPPQDLYRQYFSTYIQRDIQQVMNIRHLSEFKRFIIICASRIGTEFNAQGISNELGVSIPTIQEWMNVLEASYIAFRLQPFYRNIGKRLIKTPKIYANINKTAAIIDTNFGSTIQLNLKFNPAKTKPAININPLNNNGKNINLIYGS